MTPIPCAVCHRDTETKTCPRCLHRSRSDLNRVADLYALLPAELTGHGAAASPWDASGVRSRSDGLPDVLVLIATGTASEITASRHGDRTHARDQLPSDPPSVIAVLASWEDDWRSIRQLSPAMKAATVTGCTLFLQQNLTWAADKHPAFAEFVGDIHKLCSQLEQVMRTKMPHEDAYIPCPDCGGQLEKRYRPPDPCPPGCAHINGSSGHDQGGRRDEWHCRDRRGCGRVLDFTTYWLYVRELFEQQQEQVC